MMPRFDEVRLRVLPLAEGPVVVLDDPGEDSPAFGAAARHGGARPRPWLSMPGLAVARRCQRRERRPLLDSRPVLHEPREIEARPPRQRLERAAEAHLVVLRHEADDVARGAAAEAVVRAPSPKRR